MKGQKRFLSLLASVISMALILPVGTHNAHAADEDSCPLRGGVFERELKQEHENWHRTHTFKNMTLPEWQSAHEAHHESLQAKRSNHISSLIECSKNAAATEVRSPRKPSDQTRRSPSLSSKVTQPRKNANDVRKSSISKTKKNTGKNTVAPKSSREVRKKK